MNQPCLPQNVRLAPVPPTLITVPGLTEFFQFCTHADRKRQPLSLLCSIAFFCLVSSTNCIEHIAATQAFLRLQYVPAAPLCRMTSPATRAASDRSSRTGGVRAPAPTAAPSGQTIASQDDGVLHDKVRDLEKGLAEASQKESEVTQVL